MKNLGLGISIAGMWTGGSSIVIRLLEMSDPSFKVVSGLITFFLLLITAALTFEFKK